MCSSTEPPGDAGDRQLCPSYKCVAGSQLIGILQANGSVAFLGVPLTIDKQFVDTAAQGRPAELRFRFAGRCAKGGCANWAADGCGIAARISVSSGSTAARGELPDCGIRADCRWFRERGATACAACPAVMRGSEAAELCET
jgi:hypothetical protein